MANCAIVGINWGDEGKGRMVDYLTAQYDVVCDIRAAVTPGTPSSTTWANLPCTCCPPVSSAPV